MSVKIYLLGQFKLKSTAMEARKKLGDFIGWFTEGFETAYLRSASALLGKMGGSFPA